MTTYRALTVLIALALSLAALPRADGQGTSDEFVWVHQFGTSSDDYGSAVAVDGSSVYIAGRMLGSFPGDAYDAYLRKYDVSGSVLWIRQFGTDSFEYANAVATNGSAVYVAGLTGGSLEGGVPSNGVDAFLRTYDVDGNVLWTRQFGSIDFDTALAVAVDGTSAYVAGRTEGTIPGEMRLGGVDAFIRKYSVDRNGTVSWTRQFGTSAYDVASSLAVDATGMYV